MEPSAPESLELGLLSGQFQTEFADYCLQHSLHVQLWRLIKQLGEKQAIANGYMKAFQTASQQRLRLAAKFGFDPADSTGIKVKPNRPDPLDIYFPNSAQVNRPLASRMSLSLWGIRQVLRDRAYN